MLRMRMERSVANRRKQDAAAAKEKEAAHALAVEIDDLRAQQCRRLAERYNFYVVKFRLYLLK
jgi:hypothetical protein